MEFENLGNQRLYISVLRCKTWHIWPEHMRITSQALQIPVDISRGVSIVGSVHFVSYEKRSRKTSYPTKAPQKHFGPIIWRGKHKSSYIVSESIIQATQDSIRYKIQYEPAYKGEIDVQLHFIAHDGLNEAVLKEAALSASLAALAFINLNLDDLLTPVAPIQVFEIIGNNQLEVRSEFTVWARQRVNLESTDLQNVAEIYSRVFANSSPEDKKERLRIALGLYSAHFYERSNSMRFLTLVMALEALATPVRRPRLVQGLLSQWKAQLEEVKSQLDPNSEDALSLDALARELLFRREDSLRNQIRRLVFEATNKVKDVDPLELSRKALKIYDQRSLLVHEGKLSRADLSKATQDAKEILEYVLKSECQMVT